MKRDYSDDMLWELKGTIREINDEEWFFLSDALGDFGYYFGSWIGLLDAESHVDNIKKYHKKVLDQHNTTASKLEEIFEKVRLVDNQKCAGVCSMFHAASDYNKLLLKLTETFDFSKGGFTSKNIEVQTKDVVAKVKESSDALDGVYSDILNEKAGQLAADASWGLLTGFLSFGGDVLGFCINCASGNYAQAAADMWGAINSFFGFASDLTCLGAIGIGYVASWFAGDDALSFMIEEAEQLEDNDGLADVMADEGWEDAAVVVSGIDILADGVGFVGGIKDIFDGMEGVSEFGKIWNSDILSDELKVTHVANLLLENLGFSTGSSSGGGIVEDLKNWKKIIDNTSNILSWTEGIANGEAVETGISNLSGLGVIEDGKDIVVDIVTDIILPIVY